MIKILALVITLPLMIFSFNNHAQSHSTNIVKITELRSNDPQASVALAESLWQESDGKDIPLGIALLISYKEAKVFSHSLAIIDKLLALNTASSEQLAKLYLLRLNAMYKLKNWDEQDELIKNIETLVVLLEKIDTKAKLYLSIAKIKYAQFDLEEAEQYFVATIKTNGEDNNIINADAYENLGVVKAQQGKFPEATQALLTSIKNYENLEKTVPASLYNNLGGLSLYLKEWDKAIDYLTKAIELLKPSQISQKASSYANIGTAYVEKKDLKQAYQFFEKSLALTEQIGKDNPTALNNMGYVLKEQQHYQKALAKFEQVETIYLKQKNSGPIGIAKKNLGDTWVELNDLNKAAQYYQQAYDIYQAKEFRPKLIELYPVMVKNFEQLNDWPKALKFMKEYKALNDEMINVQSKERIAKLQSAFELEKTNKELIRSEKSVAQLERDQVIKDKALLESEINQKKQQAIRLVLVVIVVVLVIIGLILLRTNRFRARTNEQLTLQNNEIEANQIKLQELNEQLKQQSLEDPLTGLNNRRYLEGYIQKDIARIQRLKMDGIEEKQLVIMIDLDKFKAINDNYGHQTGDKVLSLFAAILKKCGRESDIQVRWGGEEFLWYCPATSFDEGEVLCQRLQSELSKEFITVDGKDLFVTCSVGFVEFPLWGEPNQDWENSIKVADAALYQAKQEGRDRWVGIKTVKLVDKPPQEKLSVEQLIQAGYLTAVSK